MNLKTGGAPASCSRTRVRHLGRGPAARDGVLPSFRPGSVRILGGAEICCLLRRADAICRGTDSLTSHQPVFAVFPPVRSVGVMGDGRRWLIVVRCGNGRRFHDLRTGAPRHEFWITSLRRIERCAGISRASAPTSPQARQPWTGSNDNQRQRPRGRAASREPWRRQGGAASNPPRREAPDHFPNIPGAVVVEDSYSRPATEQRRPCSTVTYRQREGISAINDLMRRDVSALGAS